MNQLSLFDAQNNDLFADIRPHIVKRFWIFHELNPHIFNLFKRFVAELRRTGRNRYGAKSIAERIRWHVATETTDEEFKICNNHTSCYARLLIMDDPSLTGFFQLKGHDK